MNILMLGRWIPPPRRPVRSTREFQIARHLARHHQLTLAFITDSREAAGPITVLRSEFGELEFAAIPRGWKSLASAVRLASGESATLSYFRSEALRTRLAERLRRTKYDLVFVSSSSMIQYALDVSPSIPMVVDFGEVDSEWWARQAARGSFPAARFFQTEAARLRSAEAVAAGRASLCLTETAEAAEIVQAMSPGAPVRVIPSGVEVDPRGPSSGLEQAPTVVFGAWFRGEAGRSEALEFYRSIMPGVRACVPEARFVIASRESIPGGRGEKDAFGVEVAAGADPRALFHGRAVAVAPARAGFDLRASVLEPMASGIAVVTTSGICERLGASAGRDVRVADAVADVGRELIFLLESGSRREEIGASGRAFVEANFSWDAITSRLDQLLAGLGKVGPGFKPTVKPQTVGVVRRG